MRAIVRSQINVIDKDLASAVLACEVEADLLVLATDVDGVYENWGGPDARLIEHITSSELRRRQFDTGSMGPKVKAAISFVEDTGGRAVIGALSQLTSIVDGSAGTLVENG